VLFAFSQSPYCQQQSESFGGGDVMQLREEVLKLRGEVVQLKAEVQQLRKLLATPSPSPSYSNPTPQSQTSPSTEQGEDTGYWCTKSSNKRHNPSCRYYKTSNGRPCGPNDGIPCKLCGG
jgi:hypothetical protein